MPAFLDPDALEKFEYLRLGVMGKPKVGKTTKLIQTSPGPVGVIICENESAIAEAKRQSDAKYGKASKHFSVMNMETKLSPSGSAKYQGSWAEVLTMLRDIRAAVSEGKFKTILIDPFNYLGDRLEHECLGSDLPVKNHGQQAYPIYWNRLTQVMDNLFSLPAHIIMCCHSITDDESDGRMPMFSGKAAGIVGGRFPDVIWMELTKDQTMPADDDGERRVFITGPKGAWGRGARNLSGTHIIPANVSDLIELFKGTKKLAPAKVVGVTKGSVSKTNRAGENVGGRPKPPPPPSRRAT